MRCPASGEEITYGALAAAASRLAGRLQARGVGRNEPVGCCLGRGIAAIVAQLGILWAGGAYLPLDAGYPADRLALMLQDAGARRVVADRALWTEKMGATPEAVTVEIVACETVEATAAEAPDFFDDPPEADGDALAYVLYTSGSTGRPKGVAMPHAALNNLLCWHASALPLPDGPGTRVAQFAPLSFDVSFQEIFSTLTAGGTLVLVDEATRRDPRGLLRLLTDEKVARLFLPPVMLGALAEAAAEIPEAALPRQLREIIVAGEALRITPAITRFFERLPGSCALHNHYGPTETHVVTACRLEGAPASWPELPTIGQAIDGVEILLLDESGNPAPAGEPGEIFVAGACLAQGYLHDPERTAARFPVDPRTGARRYRTGDLARRLPNGDLQFLGRADDQVKIRGFRVEPGEIETVLARHPEVRAAAVAVTGEGTRRLVAGFVPRVPDAVPSEDSLRQWLRATLPDYMLPARFAALPQLPLTSSGKIDRRAVAALPVFALGAAVGDAAPVVQNAGAEAVVAGVWSRLLGREGGETLDPQSSFFDLGGDSLLAIQAHETLRRELHLDFPIAEFFGRPTARALGRFLDEALAARATAAPRPDGNLSIAAADRAGRQRAAAAAAAAARSRRVLTAS